MNFDHEYFRRPSEGERLAEFVRQAADLIQRGEPIRTNTDWITVSPNSATGVTRIQVDVWVQMPIPQQPGDPK